MVSVQIISNNAEFRKKLKQKLKGEFDFFSSSSLKDGFRNVVKLSHDLLVIDIENIQGKVENILRKVRTLNSQDEDKVSLLFLADPKKAASPEIVSLFSDPSVEGIHFLSGETMDEKTGAILVSLKKYHRMLQYKRNYTLIKKQLESATDELDFLRSRNAGSDNSAMVQDYSFLFGESDEAKTLRLSLKNLPPHKTAILLTGKDPKEAANVTEYIYFSNKSLKKWPLITTDLSQTPAHMQENLLFGKDEPTLPDFTPIAEGLLEKTGKGVLFLQNIEEMDWQTQTRFFRTLREGFFYKGEQKVNVRCRIIVYAKSDLGKSVDRGILRQELVTHLSAHNIEVPSLQQRKADIPALIDYYAERYKQKHGKAIFVDPEAKKNLMRRRWNEGSDAFFQYLNELFSLSNGHVDTLTLQMTDKYETSGEQMFENSGPTFIREFQDESPALPLFKEIQNKADWPSDEYSLEELERVYIQRLLDKHHQNISECARILGIARKTLYQKIKKYKLNEARSS